MKVISTDIKQFDIKVPSPTVVAIGNFDGVHLGHQKVIKAAIERARSMQGASVVLTFEPHPRRYLSPAAPYLRLTSFPEKVRLMKELGVDYLLVLAFNKDLAALMPETFIQTILVERLHAKHIVTGYNFTFGKARQGSTQLLKERASFYGYEYTMIPPVMIERKGQKSLVASSSAIVEHLIKGDVLTAAAILGRPHTVYGQVVQGDQRGRSLGFATANLHLSPASGPCVLPLRGVYAVRCDLFAGEEQECWQKNIKGVANIGYRPTFHKNSLCVEVHLLDFDQDIYHDYLKISFIEFLRPEIKFDRVEALKRQIAEDCHKARVCLERRASLKD